MMWNKDSLDAALKQLLPDDLGKVQSHQKSLFITEAEAQINQALKTDISLHNILPDSLTIKGIKIDSRQVQEGDLFIALGSADDENYEYSLEAFDNGAAAIMVHHKSFIGYYMRKQGPKQKDIDESSDSNREANMEYHLINRSKDELQQIDQDKVIMVNDTFYALWQLAYYNRTQINNAKFIAITGSVGKTSTKEALALMLSQFGNVYKTQANFNGQIGVAFFLASLDCEKINNSKENNYVILEMGMSQKGEMSRLSKLARPELSIITNIYSVHLEYFGKEEYIADAKLEILDGMKEGSKVIFDSSSIYYDKCQLKAQSKKIETFAFGNNKARNNIVSLDSYQIINDEKVSAKFSLNSQKSTEITLAYAPEHIVKNFQTILALAQILQLDIEKAAARLSNFTLEKSRGKIQEYQLNAENNQSFRVICDYYNASPLAVEGALKSLNNIQALSKIAVLGDMESLDKWP